MLTAKQHAINAGSSLGIVFTLALLAKYGYHKPLDYRVILILPMIYFAAWTYMDKLKSRPKKDTEDSAE